MKKNVVIIGNGIAGITAARFIRKFSDHSITVISEESDHFYSRTALMYIYMGHMTYENTKPYEDWFWKKNRIELVRGYVTSVETDGKKLHLAGGNVVNYDVLILATGSRSRKFGWPGQDLKGCKDCTVCKTLSLWRRIRGESSVV
ncbi:MAG: FAD-dependent oxidoreductase [Candidatus Kapaibacterium sp.]